MTNASPDFFIPAKQVLQSDEKISKVDKTLLTANWLAIQAHKHPAGPLGLRPATYVIAAHDSFNVRTGGTAGDDPAHFPADLVCPGTGDGAAINALLGEPGGILLLDGNFVFDDEPINLASGSQVVGLGPATVITAASDAIALASEGRVDNLTIVSTGAAFNGIISSTGPNAVVSQVNVTQNSAGGSGELAVSLGNDSQIYDSIITTTHDGGDGVVFADGGLVSACTILSYNPMYGAGTTKVLVTGCSIGNGGGVCNLGGAAPVIYLANLLDTVTVTGNNTVLAANTFVGAFTDSGAGTVLVFSGGSAGDNVQI